MLNELELCIIVQLLVTTRFWFDIKEKKKKRKKKKEKNKKMQQQQERFRSNGIILISYFDSDYTIAINGKIQNIIC